MIRQRRQTAFNVVFWAFLTLLSTLLLTASSSPGALSEDDQACFACHDTDQTLTFSNGDKYVLKVNKQEVEKSVHGIIGCSTCHGFTADKHPQTKYKTRQEFSSLNARRCTQCHAQGNNPIHNKMTGSMAATICTDCHGFHNVKRVKELSQGNQYCLACHSREIDVHYRNGEKGKIVVKGEVLNASVHKNLSCVDCHVRVASESHPIRDFKSRRDFSLVMAESCRRCHFDKYTKTLEGIHYKALSQGNTKAPLCTDCHGTHAITSARKDKLTNAKRCQQCHQEIYAVYAKSVHGAALIGEHIEDVPICSDCHRAHDNTDTHTADFRISIPALCAGCHGKKEIMQKYGLSTKVVDTYLSDFHGVTMKFYKQFGSERQIAVCIDCHGIHDITRVKGVNSTVIKENLVKRCQKCHPGATSRFPDSWISHYEPTMKKSPVIFLINWGYKIFIPFMIIGLLLQILLHMWRYSVNR